MQFRIEQRFAAPLAEVEAAFLDPEFLDRLGQLPKVEPPQLLEQRRDGDVVHQRVRYRFSGSLSPVVRRVVDADRLTWVEETRTDLTTHRTELRIHPDHYPDRLRCHATIELTGAGDGCVRRTEGEVHVPMPLVGRRAEAAIVSGLQEHARDEAEVVNRWLQERKDTSTG